MKSSPGNTPSRLLAFPAGNQIKATSLTKESVASGHAAEIHELCRETSSALQELRHGVLNVLYGTIERLGMDTKMLARALDERPNIVRKLVDKDDDGITTEMIIEYLERLLPYLQPK